MTDPAVRPATPTDAPVVKRVARTSWHAAYDGLLGADVVDETVDEWYDADRLADAARDDEHVFHVAVTPSEGDEAEVVAFAHAVPDDEDDGLAHLIRLYALPDWWGEGVGTVLLDRTEAALRTRGVDRLRLTVFAENEVGVGFYEARGFDRVEEREAVFDGETHLERVYEKRL